MNYTQGESEPGKLSSQATEASIFFSMCVDLSFYRHCITI